MVNVALTVAGAVGALWCGLIAADYRGIATKFASSEWNRAMRPWPLPELSPLVHRFIGACGVLMGVIFMIAGIKGQGYR